MLHVRCLFTLRAVIGIGVGIVVAAVAPLHAQSASEAGALGEMPLPGGLRGALAAIDDRAAADRSQFLLDFIRRSYDTPIRVKSDPRDPPLRALLARLDPSNQTAGGPFDALTASGPSVAHPGNGTLNGAAVSPATLPLPLPAAIWIDVVFRGRATPQTLSAAIVRSRNASLLYYGLLSLDDPTRAWLATRPDLIADLAERHPAAFAAAAPGLRIVNAALVLPGGDDAEPAWKALVGRRTTEPVEYVRTLLAQGEGRLALLLRRDVAVDARADAVRPQPRRAGRRRSGVGCAPAVRRLRHARTGVAYRGARLLAARAGPDPARRRSPRGRGRPADRAGHAPLLERRLRRRHR